MDFGLEVLLGLHVLLVFYARAQFREDCAVALGQPGDDLALLLGHRFGHEF